MRTARIETARRPSNAGTWPNLNDEVRETVVSGRTKAIIVRANLKFINRSPQRMASISIAYVKHSREQCRSRLHSGHRSSSPQAPDRHCPHCSQEVHSRYIEFVGSLTSLSFDRLKVVDRRRLAPQTTSCLDRS